MTSMFLNKLTARGYARARPTVHPQIIKRIQESGILAHGVLNVLDVGCGAGLSTLALSELAKWRIGIDPFETMLQHWVGNGRTDIPICGRGEALPFKPGTFQLITTAGSLNWIDLEAFSQSAERVLTASGHLVAYDFETGRTFSESAALLDWFECFEKEFPFPDYHPVSCKILVRTLKSFDLRHFEEFELSVRMNAQEYWDYIWTEVDVERAKRWDRLKESVRMRFQQALWSVFQGESRDVIFPSFVAVFTKKGHV